MVATHGVGGPSRAALVAHSGLGVLCGGGQAGAGYAHAGPGLETAPIPSGDSCLGGEQAVAAVNKNGRFDGVSVLNPVVIYTDGACKGNPGPGGWGVYLKAGGHEKELWGGERETTNNRMELTAVIEALAALKRPCQVALYLDSEYVRKGITEWIHGWKAKGWKTAAKQPVKNADLWQKLDALVHGGIHKIEWHWVKGHAGDPGNEHADALANRGVPR